MDEIQKDISLLDLKTILLLLLGWSILIVGRYYNSYFTKKKLIIYIKVIPILLSLSMIVIDVINKVHLEFFERTFLVMLLIFSVTRFFPKWQKWHDGDES